MEKSIIEPIKNYNTYNIGMNKSFYDKLFFYDKVEDITSILDFGCADGSMIKHMRQIYPEMNLVGYDNNEAMIQAARANSKNYFTTNFTTAIENISPNNTLLNLSSVIHEVYAYSTESDIDEFWNRVFNNGFAYISIRDFCHRQSMDRPSDIADYVKVIQKSDSIMISEFEQIFGSLRNNKNLVHFLMKYRYKDNWKREVRENYFPITIDTLLHKIPMDKYEIIYFEDYILPFTKQQVYKDFGITLKDSTHVKLLLKRK